MRGGSDDEISGGLGNDPIAGGAGNDRMIGGVGIDTAVFTGGIDGYEISRDMAGRLIVVDHVLGRDGADALQLFEYVEFAGVSYAVADLLI